MRLLLGAALIAAATYPDLPKQVGDERGRVASATGLPGPTVLLRVASITPIGDDDAAWRSRLVLLGVGGQPVWSGEPEFGGGPGGEDQLEAAGSGRVILVRSQSDYRIPTHLILAWKRGTFQVAGDAMFLEQPAKSGRFLPTTDGNPRGRWIQRFERAAGPGRWGVAIGTPQGELRAEVVAWGKGFQRMP